MRSDFETHQNGLSLPNILLPIVYLAFFNPYEQENRLTNALQRPKISGILSFNSTPIFHNIILYKEKKGFSKKVFKCIFLIFVKYDMIPIAYIAINMVLIYSRNRK